MRSSVGRPDPEFEDPAAARSDAPVRAAALPRSRRSGGPTHPSDPKTPFRPPGHRPAGWTSTSMVWWCETWWSSKDMSTVDRTECRPVPKRSEGDCVRGVSTLMGGRSYPQFASVPAEVCKSVGVSLHRFDPCTCHRD
jgi:hypothetical protein